MGATMDSVNAITKEIYGPRIVDQVERSAVLSRRMEKTSQGTSSDTGGKWVTFPLKVRRNHGIGYRNELEQLQAPGQQGYTNVRVPLRYGYGRVHMSGQAMKLAETNSQAFASAMREEMDGLRDDIVKDTNRIMWGNGLGVLATVASDAANTITVDDMRWLELDAQVDILSADGQTVRASNRKITAVNLSTKTATYNGADASAGVVAGDIVVRTGNYGKEPQGMSSLVRTGGTLFGLSATAEPKWSSIEDNNVGNLSETRMIAMCDALRQNGGTPSVIFSDLASRRAYFNLLTTQRRMTNTQKFDGGFTGLAFAYDQDIPLVTDVDAPAGKMWFVDESHFKQYRINPWDWEDLDGSIWKWVTGYDAWEALMKQYWEFAVDRRNVHGVMSGINAG